ncbi:hypothetical protein J31TS4_05580 [Paenibacillus sp. J31TS4]|uniref:YciI family protein n=1 Tax=Paenibacillus sp. J31TS4 TaxID=2807195 RepID=UPI001B003BC7|nr:YciI family protein [Paenibacillus sp. J31TS4]GIP37278.1 hypothetical protein J31TS4_05580 [Paenibacillus sp. J31TS4]
MKYFAVFLPMKDEALSQEYRPAHLEYLQKLKEEDKLFVYGRFVDGSGGLVVYQGESYEDVKALVEQDPYVVHKARDYEIREWALVR